MKTAEQISILVNEQLSLIEDPKVRDRISEFLVTPYSTEREWDYGHPGEKYTCWMVLEHTESNTGIAFCSEGFGPKCPWGLLHLTGVHTSMGMDSGWYPTLELAFRESWAADDSMMLK